MCWIEGCSIIEVQHNIADGVVVEHADRGGQAQRPFADSTCAFERHILLTTEVELERTRIVPRTAGCDRVYAGPGRFLEINAG